MIIVKGSVCDHCSLSVRLSQAQQGLEIWHWQLLVLLWPPVEGVTLDRDGCDMWL